jgi:hypothetical protein
MLRRTHDRSFTPTRALGALSALCIVLHAFGCAGSEPPARTPRSQQSHEELAMREPAARTPGIDQLGNLEPVAVAAQPEQRVQPAVNAAPAEQPPIRIAREHAPRPYPLRNGALVLSGGLIIHDVPRDVAVHSVVEQGSRDPVLELVDPRGRRVALLKETALSSVAMPGGAPLLGATAATHSQAKRDDWATSPVQVVVDRFSSETHLYTLERRAAGTDWIWAGLELSPRRAGSGGP